MQNLKVVIGILIVAIAVGITILAYIAPDKSSNSTQIKYYNNGDVLTYESELTRQLLLDSVKHAEDTVALAVIDQQLQNSLNNDKLIVATYNNKNVKVGMLKNNTLKITEITLILDSEILPDVMVMTLEKNGGRKFFAVESHYIDNIITELENSGGLKYSR